MTNHIASHLWFDKEALEAATFYCDVFPDSAIRHTGLLRDTPSGDCETVSFSLMGCPFEAISAGPYFSFNPSISFIVNFDPSRDPDARARLDEAWDKLSVGGTVLMQLGRYPFSEHYGWIKDKYGVSWQLIFTNPHGEPRPGIVPNLLFTEVNCGKAEEAREYYVSIFKNARMGNLVRYGPDAAPDKEGTVMFSDFMLEGTWFAAMDSAREHGYGFNEAISFIVYCDTQEEIDEYWSRLSAVPEAEQCGWLKDKYGVSWQIVPAAMHEMLANGTREQIDRVTRTFLKMKKIDIGKLQEAFVG